MANPVQVPAWLLRRLFLKSGAFNGERTVVISGPQGQPTGTGTFSIDLTRRSDWEEVQRLLAQEGFLEARAGSASGGGRRFGPRIAPFVS